MLGGLWYECEITLIERYKFFWRKMAGLKHQKFEMCFKYGIVTNFLVLKSLCHLMMSINATKCCCPIALEELSECLNISQEELMRNISPLNFDAIKVRAIAGDVEDGSIPFDDGLKLLFSSYKLLKSCSKKIQKFKNKNKHLSSYYSNIGMGQTQLGSYVVSLHSPLYRVGTSEESELFDGNVSLGRMINKMFYAKLAKVSAVFSEEG